MGSRGSVKATEESSVVASVKANTDQVAARRNGGRRAGSFKGHVVGDLAVFRRQLRQQVAARGRGRNEHHPC